MFHFVTKKLQQQFKNAKRKDLNECHFFLDWIAKNKGLTGPNDQYIFPHLAMTGTRTLRIILNKAYL